LFCFNLVDFPSLAPVDAVSQQGSVKNFRHKGMVGTGSQQGSVTYFSAEKGFGFIEGIAEGNDIFLRAKSLVDGSTPQQGDTITFDVEPSRSKPGQMQATNATGGTGWASGGGMCGGKVEA
jgi:cold shock CspA family protein